MKLGALFGGLAERAYNVLDGAWIPTHTMATSSTTNNEETADHVDRLNHSNRANKSSETTPSTKEPIIQRCSKTRNCEETPI